MSLAPGTRLGPYEIVAPLGAGGMGEVYRARDSRLGREVAVKVLPAEFARDADRLRRFEQEARAASALNHPGILTVFDVGATADNPYLVTELLEGRSLRAVLAGGEPIALRRALGLGAQIARALAAAHEKGIVHRDLKPENLFVTRDGRVKILDFGLAKLTLPEVGSPLADATTLAGATETGTVMGTVGYMAPEQVRGERVDARADLFSLGCVLFELLTGERAFRAATAADTLSAILRDEPGAGATGAGRRALPPSVERIVRHCLEKAPQERFHAARDLAFDLESLATELAGPSPAPPAAGPQPERRGRRRALAAAAAVVAILAVAAVLVLGRRGAPPVRGAASRPASIAVLPFVNMSSDPEQEYFSDGLAEELLGLLAQIPQLRVAGRTSSFSFKGKNEDLREIGKKLNVATVLEGSVRKSGDQLRVTAQLIDVADGFHLWSHTYERRLTDVFALQDEIARAVVAALEIQLLPAERAGRTAPRAAHPEAYSRYLLGRSFVARGDIGDLVRAAEELEKAVELDPDYAAAHALLGRTLLRVADETSRSTAEMAAGFRRARSEIDRALELDPRLAESYYARGVLRRQVDWDWPGTEADYRRAIVLDPNDPRFASSLGYFLATQRRFPEAIASARRGTELDPLSPLAWRTLGDCLEWSGDLAGARAAWQRALEIYPQDGRARLRLSLLSLREGDASAALAQSEGTTSEIFLLETRALALDALGRGTEAEPLLTRMIEKHAHNAAIQVAEVYSLRGDAERAFEWLERAYVQRDSGMPLLAVTTTFRSLRADPRFRELLRRMNLPEPG